MSLSFLIDLKQGKHRGDIGTEIERDIEIETERWKERERDIQKFRKLRSGSVILD